MKTEVLSEYVTFAQHLNFSAAAKKLHIAQPRLSVHMADLEKELGFALVSRTRPLSLTLEGELFLETAQQVLADLDSATRRCKRSSLMKPIDITVAKPAFAEFFPPPISSGLNVSLSRITDDYPQAHLTMPYASVTHSEIDALVDGLTDLSYILRYKRSPCALVHNDTADTDASLRSSDANRVVRTDGLANASIAINPVLEQRFHAFVTKVHPLAGQDEVSLADLALYPILVPGCLEAASYTQAVEDLFGSSGLDPIVRTVHVDAAAAFLTTSLREHEAFVLPSYLCSLVEHFDMESITISDACACGELCVAYLVPFKSKAHEALVNCLLAQPYGQVTA